MKVKSESEVAQSFPTLRDLMDCSLPGSSIQGIFQARVLEWGAIAFSDTRRSINVFRMNEMKLLQMRIGDVLLVLKCEMAPHSSTLAWKIPWMEEPSRLQSMGS